MKPQSSSDGSRSVPACHSSASIKRVGQVILAVLLSAYVATLLWMRRMAVAKPLPRFLDLQARTAHRASQRSVPGEKEGAFA